MGELIETANFVLAMAMLAGVMLAALSGVITVGAVEYLLAAVILLMACVYEVLNRKL